jgi:cholesterol 24-hydroxylase
MIIAHRDLVMPGWAQNMYNQKYFPNPDNFDPTRWL